MKHAALIRKQPKAFICLLIALISSPAAATPELNISNPYTEKLKAYISILSQEQKKGASLEDPQLADKLIEKLSESSPSSEPNKDLTDQLQNLKPNVEQNKSEKKTIGPKGILDPHYPFIVKTDPQDITLPSPIKPVLLGKINLEKIPLTILTPDLLKQLTREQLKTLLAHLDKIPMKVKWQDKEGHTRTGKKHFKLFRTSKWIETTATAALALRVGVLQQRELLTTMIALSPGSITKILQGEAAAIIDAQVAARALVDILTQVTAENTHEIAAAAENIAQVYIGYWAETYPDQLILSLTKLVVETSKLISCFPEPFTHKQKGVLLGALLAGSMAHAGLIKSKDDRRLWIINSISNLVWASSTFLGAIPIAATITASVAGVISVGVVAWAVVYNKIGSRDYTPKIREIEGHIEFSALELAEAKKDRGYMVDMLETLAWMRAAIHVNGNFD